jgi:membrane protease YdiL (CAAX protease family)
MANSTSQNILSASSSLLGFCLVVITSFHLTGKADSSIIDEFTSVIAMFLIFSGFCSFLSLRSTKPPVKKHMENIAEYLFLIALTGVMLIILLLVFKLIR